MTLAVPKPDYLSRDYASLRQSTLAYAAQVFPEWSPSSVGDFGVVMVESMAYMGDILSYYTDRAQFENYLATATQRESVVNLAYLLGYIPNSGSPASGTVYLANAKGQPSRTVFAGTKLATNRIEVLDGPVTVEVVENVVLPANPEGEAAAVLASVVEGETETLVKIGESTGQPTQSFMLAHTGVYRETIRVYVEDVTGSTLINEGTPSEFRVREWTQLDHLLDAEDDDKSFEVRYLGNSAYVYFGDDINGAIPATGLQIFATYRHGAGYNGNVPAGLVRHIVSRGNSLSGVTVARDAEGLYRSSALTGGSDPESTDSIRYNAPRVYRTQNRAVTGPDFIEVALGTEGVSRANVVIGTFTSVTLFITGPDGAAPTASLKQAVLDRLDGKTLAGVTVQVASPTFITVNFSMDIDVLPTHSQKTVRAAVKRDLRALVANMAFGEKMTVGKVYRAVTAVDGVMSAEINLMARSDAAQTGTTKITPKAWEVFQPGTITTNLTGGVA